MASGRAPAPNRSKPEHIEIVSGRLGPLEAQSIEIKPFTVLVGRQGTGKSLVAQMLYLFRALGDLARLEAGRRVAGARKRPVKLDVNDVFGRVVDGLRSGHRRFANLTVPNATIAWRGVHALSDKPEELRFNAQFATRQINASRRPITLMKSAIEARTIPLGAVFVPTERLLVSLLPAAELYRSLELPLIFESFTTALERLWDAGQDATPDVLSAPLLEEARGELRRSLGGELHRTATMWKWRFASDEQSRSLDLDMASSGQRSNAFFDPIALGLLALRARGRLGQGFTLYVEEPEIHLHPEAERRVVELLGVLVHHGIRVVITTHSLTVLQSVNNLLLRSKLAPRRDLVRLDPKDAEAYLFSPDGRARALVDRRAGFIDETALGHVADDLQSEMNRIAVQLHELGALR